jgi:hypothetical protein
MGHGIKCSGVPLLQEPEMSRIVLRIMVPSTCQLNHPLDLMNNYSINATEKQGTGGELKLMSPVLNYVWGTETNEK